MIESNAWFKDWFNSPYYHLLYKNRNFQEAAKFIEELSSKLPLGSNNSVLDLGCGKGRHSNELGKHYSSVKGIDLSNESISFAKKTYSNITFEVGDMRVPFGEDKYQGIFNLFTSFGYFEDEMEDFKVLQNVKQALAPNGIFVQDFLNATWVENTLVKEEKKAVEGVTFLINRKIEANHVIKSIKFKVNGENFAFQEKVKLINLDTFKEHYNTLKLNILDIYGSYDLQSYHPEKSNRLILVSQKQ